MKNSKTIGIISCLRYDVLFCIVSREIVLKKLVCFGWHKCRRWLNLPWSYVIYLQWLIEPPIDFIVQSDLHDNKCSKSWYMLFLFNTFQCTLRKNLNGQGKTSKYKFAFAGLRYTISQLCISRTNTDRNRSVIRHLLYSVFTTCSICRIDKKKYQNT